MQKTFVYASDADLSLDKMSLVKVEQRGSCTQFEAGGSYLSVIEKVRMRYESGSDLALRREDFVPKAVFFDMDSTLIGQESLVEMARFLGKGEDVDRMTELAMAGKMDFEASLRQRLKVLRGVPSKVLTDVLPKLTLNPGVEDFIACCATKSIKCFLISGGFVELAQPFARRLGLDDFHAHRLEQRGGVLTGEWTGPIVDAAAKDTWVQTMLRNHHIPSGQAVVVGDGANDLPMMRGVGYAVGFRAKEVLYPALHAHLGRGHYDFLQKVFFS